MTKPDYIKIIDVVAKRYSHVATYEERLLNTWKEFEHLAKSDLESEYDLLKPLPTHFIQLTEQFITLLYENNDATPQADCDQIREKDAAYGGSWHARGGTGAFHALARKGDRLVSMLNKHGTLDQCRKDKTNSESIDDTIGDLRRYLILILSWHEARRQTLGFADPEEESSARRQKLVDELKKEIAEAREEEEIVEDEPATPVRYCHNCAHSEGTHDEDGCNELSSVTGVICDCRGFRA